MAVIGVVMFSIPLTRVNRPSSLTNIPPPHVPTQSLPASSSNADQAKRFDNPSFSPRCSHWPEVNRYNPSPSVVIQIDPSRLELMDNAARPCQLSGGFKAATFPERNPTRPPLPGPIHIFPSLSSARER